MAITVPVNFPVLEVWSKLGETFKRSSKSSFFKDNFTFVLLVLPKVTFADPDPLVFANCNVRSFTSNLFRSRAILAFALNGFENTTGSSAVPPIADKNLSSLLPLTVNIPLI